MATGKIARLPREVREQLNWRLENGEPGNRLVVWLNELPEVKALLVAEFGGCAINEQNLSNWKQGGYRDWVTERRVESWGSRLAGEKGSATSEQLLTLYTVRYLMMVRDWAREKEANPKRCMRKWRVLGQDVMKLRQSEHRAERLKLDWERLKFGREKFEDQKQTEERRAMIGFLVAARQWPEVSEALEGAFRLVRERKKAEGTTQTQLVDCSPSPVSSPPRRGGCLGQVLVQGCDTTSPVAGFHVPKGVDRTELESIKVNQGQNILKRDGGMGYRVSCSVSHKVSRSERDKICRSATDSTRLRFASSRQASVFGVNWTELDQIKVNQGGIFIKRGGTEGNGGNEVGDDRGGVFISEPENSRTRTRRRTRRKSDFTLTPYGLRWVYGVDSRPMRWLSAVRHLMIPNYI